MGDFRGRLLALWHYRGFVWSMVAREFRSRYLGSLLGSLWAVLNPLAMIFIYTVIFSRVMRAKLPGIDDSMAYGLFVCAGLLPWLYFVELLSRFPNIFIEQAALLKKVSFPRITLPVIALCSATINFLIIFSLFLAFLLFTGRFPGWVVLGYLPLLLAQQMFVVGLGVMLGSVNVFFRDIGQFINVVLQFWFWFTPIVYALAMVPEKAQHLLRFNPMTALVEAYQKIILYGAWPDLAAFAPHFLGGTLALAGGFLVFHRLADEMVDEL
ncbi:MAG: ABC transporter permease [Desulfobulbaceae bacterium]